VASTSNGLVFGEMTMTQTEESRLWGPT